jgi:glycosyltransferase involved in cell wall biosynthesis
MRLAVVNMTAGGLSGGYRKYLESVVPLIAADRRVTNLTMFLPAGVTLRMDPAIQVRPWPANSGVGLRPLAREIAASRPDVIFVPTARHAAFGETPVVVMVRNMEPLLVPFSGHRWAEGAKNLARAWAARRACERAARVIAVSRHVRDVVVERWGIAAERVGVVYHGVDRVPNERTDRMAARPTLFTAGSIRPARGLEDVISALALVQPDVRLVIAGRVDAGCEGYAARLRGLAVEAGVADRITWAGQLGARDMERAFLDCIAFVMTSRAEACPNVALEAMSCGCATVSVDHPPMPEFFADAALYYRAGEPDALAARIRDLIADPAQHDRMGSRARGQASSFTWERTRDRTIEELERAIA